MPNTVVLTGNGLSVGLNSAFSLPNITRQFYERLTPEHKSFIDHHMERLEKGDYKQTDFEEAIASIEQVYDSLKNYYDFLNENNLGDNFMDAYGLEKEQIQKHLDSVRDIIIEYTKSILELIDGHVKWGEIDEKLSNFIGWLSETARNNSQLDLFTLNFDLLLETILLETPEIGPTRLTDFHVKNMRKWDILEPTPNRGDDSEYTYNFSPDRAKWIYGDRNIKLHHLHGSLSSFKNIETGRIFKITTESLRYNKIYDKIFDLDIIPSIVTGGGKSNKIQENPFHFYYNEFKRKLVDEQSCCEELYIIGYSFNDGHINKAIKERLSFERKQNGNDIPLKLKIVDYKTDPEEKKKFVDHINNSLEMGPNMKNRFVYGDDRIIFDGVDAIQ